ncbi:MAG: hypothetical protein AAGI30_14395 [Planctomycetota bacterium]
MFTSRLPTLCLAVVGLTTPMSAQSLLYDGAGAPEAAGYQVSASTDSAGFQFDAPNTGELLLDTRTVSGFTQGTFAVYQALLCTADTDDDDDYDIDDAHAVIDAVDSGSPAFNRVAPNSVDAFDLGIILDEASNDVCLGTTVEITGGYTVEFGLKLLPGNEEMRIAVLEDVVDNPPDFLSVGTAGGFIELIFEGSGDSVSITINDSVVEHNIIRIPEGTFDFSDFVTVRLLRRPTDFPFFPKFYDAELPELYIDGQRINPTVPIFDLFDVPTNGLVVIPKLANDPDELVQFGDTSSSAASHAAFDFFNIIPGQTAATELGACCLPVDQCVSVTEAECDSQGGSFTPDSGCFPEQGAELFGCLTGACCLLDNTCTDIGSAELCGAIGGQFQGIDTDCATTECPEIVACCLLFAPGDPFCTLELTREECLAGDLTRVFDGFPIFADDSSISDCAVEGELCTIVDQ